MNSRERVAMTLALERPDRMPINYRAVDAVVEKLGRKNGIDYEGLLRHWHVNFREGIPPYCGPELPVLDAGVAIDIWDGGRGVYVG